IRDKLVTGVQTCALPILTEAYLKGFSTENLYAATYYLGWSALQSLGKVTIDYETWLNTIEEVEDYEEPETPDVPIEQVPPTPPEIGRASCRERVETWADS